VISVLLPFRNAARTLRRAVASVLADLGDDDELVLIDDGSTDEGSAIARAFDDRRISRLRTDGAGIAGALSQGLASSRGDLIGRMDADDVTLPGRFAAERAYLAGHPEVAVVATQIALDHDGYGGEGIVRYVAWQNALLTTEDHARAIFVESPVCHPSTLIRRDALERADGWRTGPFAEDYDLWLRLVAHGERIAKIPRVLFRWHIHDANTTFTDPRLSIDALIRLRCRHLAVFLADRPFGIWGAGRAGRAIARALEAHERRPRFFVDIDPHKVGRTARGVPILPVSEALTRTELLVVAVATRGARDLVRDLLASEGRRERLDFVCAA
jgi:glycosyltransferase involved in cell wall biosynthesis